MKNRLIVLSITIMTLIFALSAYAQEAAEADAPLIDPARIPISYLSEDGRLIHPWIVNPLDTTHNADAPLLVGEEMQFKIHYGKIRAGTAYIKVKGIMDTDFGRAYLIETRAESAKAINAFFKVRDINYSWIGVDDLSSYGYSQSIREGNYVRDEWISLDAAKKIFYGRHKKKGDPNIITGITTGSVQDMLSSLFYVRTQDINTTDELVFDVANREKTYPLVMKIIGKEKVSVPAGDFNCIIVEPFFRGEGIFSQKGKRILVWLTDDEKRIPIRMEAEVFIGSVKVSLEKYIVNK